jgi:protein-disulfide isomerase
MSKKQVRETSKRQMIREQRVKKQQQQRMTTLLGIAAVALLVVALLVVPSLLRNKNVTKPTEVKARPQASANSMGDPEAPVKIVEYSDFQCPYCKQFSVETEQQLIDAYIATGKVHFTYVPFGPAGQWIGPESEAAANAAFCAGDQNKFWEYHDYLFANQTGENIGDFVQSRLLTFGQSVGLDMAKFRSCVTGDQFITQLTQGLVQGKQAGVGGTPSFTINGKLIEGAVPFTTFQTEIEAALAASGQ